MTEKRDLIDDLMDIRDGFGDLNNLTHPLDGVADALADPNAPRFDPSQYKEKPRVNSIYCTRCSSSSLVDDATAARTCSRCLDVCPVDAIEIHKANVKVKDTCRKCGLCVMACPTEAFISSRIMGKLLYEKIARAASSHEECYVTCTRALGRLPKDNEVLLPCVGAVPREVWFSLIADYDNVNVYLPLGICDKCRTVTGEEAYVGEIAAAEEWSQESVGLEVEAKDLNHNQTRAYRRSQFMSDIRRVGQQALTSTSPVLSGAQAVANKIRAHADQLQSMQRALENSVGDKASSSHRRMLTQKRKNVLGMLQGHPALAGRMRLKTPVCDTSLCTMCGNCERACPVHACTLDDQGHFSVADAYCVNCGACVTVCPEGALSLQTCDPSNLVIRDEEAEKRKQEAAKQMEKAREAAAQGRKQLNKVLDSLEHLAD